jgi:hypothetical protein
MHKIEDMQLQFWLIESPHRTLESIDLTPASSEPSVVPPVTTIVTLCRHLSQVTIEDQVMSDLFQQFFALSKLRIELNGFGVDRNKSVVTENCQIVINDDLSRPFFASYYLQVLFSPSPFPSCLF